jgi:hypothetical protein
LLKPKASNEHEEGLLEYLEDIIGTIKYKPLLEEVSQEIDKVNEIRVEKVSRVREAVFSFYFAMLYFLNSRQIELKICAKIKRTLKVLKMKQ